jgi:catechol 2,3-dioxygenase-like lactoylglutathione lyase family enzyme
MVASHITSVAHTGVTVSDLDRSVAFFRDALGLEVSDPIHCTGEMFEQVTGVPGCVIDVVFVTLPNHTIELLCYSNPKDKANSTLRPCDNGHLHLSFNVDDIDAVIAAGRPFGFEPLNPIQTVKSGGFAGMRVMYTKGPDNLIIELMETRPTSASAH